MDVLPDLLVQTVLDAPLVHCFGVFQPERNGDVAEGSKGRDEGLIIEFHPDLVVT
jgi:hypothetical protein